MGKAFDSIMRGLTEVKEMEKTEKKQAGDNYVITVKLNAINDMSPQLERIAKQLEAINKFKPSLLTTFKFWILGINRRAKKWTIQELIDRDLNKGGN